MQSPRVQWVVTLAVLVALGLLPAAAALVRRRPLLVGLVPPAPLPQLAGQGLAPATAALQPAALGQRAHWVVVLQVAAPGWREGGVAAGEQQQWRVWCRRQQQRQQGQP
jgi:hypothetical protein